jgi:acyl-CoA synthetase (AMP-forming)/AMP-acid ligase II
MLSQRNWLSLTRLNLMRTGLETREGTVVGYVAPITHAAGGSIVANLVRGTTNLLLRKFDPDAFLRSVEEHRIAEVLLVPTMIHMLLASPEIGQRDLSSLTSIVYGTAPMAPERIREALNIFGPILSQGYAQTESCSVASMLGKYDHLAAHAERVAHRLASAGRPSPGCEVRIVDEEGKDVAVGDVGEIILRGEMVMLGYWNAPELTRETICDGWLHTRDMGRFDKDGYLYLVDRKSDMIITGGFNVYPTEVENVLYRHPAVHEAAVVSVPDPKWGETVKAVVALKPGASVSADELVQYCRAQLTPYKCPKSVDFIDELPKSPVGKILRRKVKQGYWKNSERLIA